jgi:hypothetical protein
VASAAPGRDTSNAIRVARIVCIFFMMYAHAPRPVFLPGAHSAAATLLETVATFLIDTASHASVPLLSVVSGWLLVNTYKGDSLTLVRKKASTLVWPLFLWNLVMLTVFGAGALFLHMKWQFPDSVMGWLNGFFSLADRPFNRPLYFLRDLLFCSFVGAAILAVAQPRRRHLAWGVAMLAGLALALFLPKSFVMQRAVILPSFLLGMGIAFGRYEVLSKRFINVWIAAVALIGLVLLSFVPTLAPWTLAVRPIAEGVIVIERLGFAIVGWFIVASIFKRVPALFMELEKYTFFVFCSHFVLFMGLGAVLTRIVAVTSPAIYALTFVSPVLAFAVGIPAYRLIERLSPALLGLLTGGRIRQRKQPALTGGSATTSATSPAAA